MEGAGRFLRPHFCTVLYVLLLALTLHLFPPHTQSRSVKMCMPPVSATPSLLLPAWWQQSVFLPFSCFCSTFPFFSILVAKTFQHPPSIRFYLIKKQLHTGSHIFTALPKYAVPSPWNMGSSVQLLFYLINSVYHKVILSQYLVNIKLNIVKYYLI